MEKKIRNLFFEEREDFVCFKEGYNKRFMKCDGNSVFGLVS